MTVLREHEVRVLSVAHVVWTGWKVRHIRQGLRPYGLGGAGHHQGAESLGCPSQIYDVYGR